MGNDPSEMTSHEESDALGSQDSVTGGGGGPAVSHASSALISVPEFFLDLGKARLLVNSSPQPSGPACKARSIIGRKSFTFSGALVDEPLRQPRDAGARHGICSKVSSR